MSTRTRFEKEAKGNSEMAYYINNWLDFQVFSDKDDTPEVPSHNSLKILWDVKEPTQLSKRVGHELPGVVAALFSKVAGSKYTCKRLSVYEATKKMCVNSP